jgi:hypothetical protein
VLKDVKGTRSQHVAVEADKASPREARARERLNTTPADRLKALDPNRPIREADIRVAPSDVYTAAMLALVSISGCAQYVGKGKAPPPVPPVVTEG